MAIIATGSKTIIDLSDGKSLSVYLGANQPRTQIYDVNASTYSPDWTTNAGRLIITPVIYANQTAIPLSTSSSILQLSWRKKEGSTEKNLDSDEVVSGNILTVSANKLASITSKQLIYMVTVTYIDPDNGVSINAQADITFSLLTTGENAKSAWISGEQVFKYDTSGSVSPTQITLTAHLQNVGVSQWQYKDSTGTWTEYPTTNDNATITSTSLIVRPTHAVFVNNVATIRITTTDSSIGDTTSVYKVADGGAGASSSVVFLTNENITFAGNSEGQVSAVTKTCNVVAYTGTTKVTPTVGTITGAPDGMTVTADSATNNEIPLTIAVANNSTLGGAGQLNGTLSVPVTSPVSTTLQIQWSKVNTGAAGAAGQNAVVFTVYAPNGTVFVNQEGTLQLAVQAYDGSTAISSGATYQWAKYAGGNWSNISGATSATYTVNGSDVTSECSYRCTMTYGGKTYSDVITLVDKTDNYQADIDSTAGDVFKNTVGQTCLICRLWQSGQEIDGQKATTYATAENAPVGTVGAYYYQITVGTPETKLMRHNGTAWVDVTSDATYGHSKTYTWYRRDSDGEPLDDGEAFAEGKVIYVDGGDVEVKTVFVCEVE